MKDNELICSNCGAVIDTDDYEEINSQIYCSDCVEHEFVTCDCCGTRVLADDAFGDDYTSLCSYCYHNRYTRCTGCDTLLYEDDAYHLNGEDYCRECYDEECDRCNYIHDYSYKPEPKFFGKYEPSDNTRFFGVELEIDGAGKDDDYAGEILEIANADEQHIYIKSDGSLDDGMELVSHPHTLEAHKEYNWSDVMKKAISLGYRSHQTSTCGLHIHVNRDSLADSREEQDDIISRILYFVEQHWNEILKFTRRSEYSINRWAARYGYEHTPKAIMDKAKKGNNGRYAAVNLCNYHTIEFRMFRGTLKYNTFIAAIQFVNRICDVAMNNTDDSLAKISWSEFVSGINEPELIQYLKERRLYVNEDINTEEDV